MGTINGADTALVLVSAAFVFIMTPGLAPQSLWEKFYPRKQRFLSDLAREEEVAKKRAEEEQKPSQDTKRIYFTVHCPYCGGQKLYDKNEVVYCDNEKCPNGKKPVDIDRYNLRRLIF